MEANMTLPMLQAAEAPVVDEDYEALELLHPQQALTQLVEHIVTGTTQQPGAARVFGRTAASVDEILLEAEWDGAHYFLVCRRPLAPTHVSLSPRELAIADLVAKGLPNKCIGDILEISPWTVGTHLRRMFAKLDVTSRAAMVARLIEENLL
jgi:DNA-binding CsgD family transcriptional regulator